MGEAGLLLEIAPSVSVEGHGVIVRLDQALAATPFPGLVEVVPASISLLVVFDPTLTDHASVAAQLRQMIGALSDSGISAPRNRHVMDVRYDGPDLDAVAEQTGLDRAGVIAAHSAGDYEVFMYGFAPGYAYLHGVDARLQLPRKSVAKRDVPAGSVIITGAQCLITTLTMPTGWWIIGRAVRSVLTGEAARPFLFDVGDRVAFRAIAAAEPDGSTSPGSGP